MGQVIPFQFDNMPVRAVIDESGRPWFVAADVCEALGVVNHRDAVAKLDEDEKGVALTDTLGGKQQVVTVNESGLYTLVLRCRDAVNPGTAPHRFRKWVTSEVLPALRKTGTYGQPQQTARAPQLQPVRDLLLVGKAMCRIKGVNESLAMACTLDAIERTTGLPTSLIAKALPKVEMEETATLNPTQVGKDLGLKARAVNQMLESVGFQERDENDHWVLTEAGTEHGEMKPFHRNGHSGYEIRWKASVIEVLRGHMGRHLKAV